MSLGDAQDFIAVQAVLSAEPLPMFIAPQDQAAAPRAHPNIAIRVRVQGRNHFRRESPVGAQVFDDVVAAAEQSGIAAKPQLAARILANRPDGIVLGNGFGHEHPPAQPAEAKACADP